MVFMQPLNLTASQCPAEVTHLLTGQAFNKQFVPSILVGAGDSETNQNAVLDGMRVGVGQREWCVCKGDEEQKNNSALMVEVDKESTGTNLLKGATGTEF